MLLSGSGVSIDKKIVNKKVLEVVDAGTLDAGVRQLTEREVKVVARRIDFKVSLADLMTKMSEGRGGPVTTKKVFWSTVQASEEKDAVMVLLDSPDGEVGLFFFFNNGKWTTFPDDFKP